VPKINRNIRNGSGLPFVNIKKEDNVGHSNKAVPIGLSALMS
jgi:hypothetical protein